MRQRRLPHAAHVYAPSAKHAAPSGSGCAAASRANVDAETSTPTAKLPKGPRPRAEKILTLTYCYEKMEHEGGKYGCGLPWKHEGPHVCAIEGSRNRKAKRPLSL